MVVFDTEQQRVAGVVREVAGVHGLVVVPQFRRLFASATDKDQVDVIDTSSLRVVSWTPTGHYPDGLAFVPNLDRQVIRGRIYAITSVLLG